MGLSLPLVREEGLEPSCIAALEPKSSVSANFTTHAVLVPSIGLEPTTYWLQVSCSTNWAKTAWWKIRDSNPWHSPCKGDALPAELIFQMAVCTGIEPVRAWMKTMCVNRFTNRPNGADYWDWTNDQLVNSQLLYRWAKSATWVYV